MVDLPVSPSLDCGSGKIKSPGGDMTVVHASVHYDLLNKMEQSFGYSVWNIYYNYVKNSAMQHAIAYLKSPEIAKVVTEKKYSKDQIFEMLLELLSCYGYGIPEIQETSLPESEAKISLKNSTIADFIRKRRGFTSKPTCMYISAMIAGFACVAYDGEFDAHEDKCSSSEGNYCLFTVFRSSEKFNKIFLSDRGLSNSRSF